MKKLLQQKIQLNMAKSLNIMMLYLQKMNLLKVIILLPIHLMDGIKIRMLSHLMQLKLIIYLLLLIKLFILRYLVQLKSQIMNILLDYRVDQIYYIKLLLLKRIQNLMVQKQNMYLLIIVDFINITTLTICPS